MIFDYNHYIPAKEFKNKTENESNPIKINQFMFFVL
jgi:hypothetical protein